MSQPAITVENLSKAYRIGLKEEIPDTLLSAATSVLRAPLKNLKRLRSLDTYSTNGDAEDIVWALKDVSFEVQEGEVLGVIGRNGAGKSTLLKILSRITKPTSGRAIIRGRVSSLLEVGTGFHPELSGRENVYMNGTILGMTKREIDRKFDEIVDFSGVEKFLDTPIKRYSSGMKVRLAFAVAAHLEPEILIIDEVLAVGDAEFQSKCLGKMQDVAGSGRTVLFVSHNMAAVQSLCESGLMLKHGCSEFVGDAAEAVRLYSESSAEHHCGVMRLDPHPRRRNGSQALLKEIRILDDTRRLRSTIGSGEGLVFELDVVPRVALHHPRIDVGVDDFYGTRVCTFSTYFSRSTITPIGEPTRLSCRIDRMPLAQGHYQISLCLRAAHKDVFDIIDQAISLTVEPADFFGNGHIQDPRYGRVQIPTAWNQEPCRQPTALHSQQCEHR
ncbi:MAG: ABC transporter ATP-binding protein [Planctomycetaceae bacterium]